MFIAFEGVFLERVMGFFNDAVVDYFNVFVAFLLLNAVFFDGFWSFQSGCTFSSDLIVLGQQQALSLNGIDHTYIIH